MAHTILSVQAKAASQAGALDGHEAICSCGGRFATSLSASVAAKLGDDHAAYMNGGNTAKVRARRSRKAPWER